MFVSPEAGHCQVREKGRRLRDRDKAFGKRRKRCGADLRIRSGS